MLTEVIIVLIILHPIGTRSSLVTYAISNSNAYLVYRPYFNEIRYWSESISTWNESSKELVLEYYKRACDMLRVNKVEKSAYYLSISLSMLIDLISHNFTISPCYQVRPEIIEENAEQIIEYAINSRPKSNKDFCKVYLSVALSLINKMPYSSFERVLFTPFLRYLFIASILITVMLFSILLRKKSRYEGIDVKYGKLP